MVNAKPKSPLQILIAVIILAGVGGVGAFLFLSDRFENLNDDVCATPVTVPIQGIVLDSDTRRPIPDAQIVIGDSSTAAQDQRCPRYPSQVRLVSDANGRFRGNAVNLTQQIQIVVTAAGCTTEHQTISGALFAGLSNSQPFSNSAAVPTSARPAILFIDCN